MKRGSVAIILAAACMALTGCSPEVRGAVGITLSASGDPVAIFEPCEGEVIGMRLFEVNASGSIVDTVSRWEFPLAPAPSEVDFLVGTPAPDAFRFELFAWAEHPAWYGRTHKNLVSTWFGANDLAQLDSGEVLYSEAANQPTTGTRAQFDDFACPEE